MAIQTYQETDTKLINKQYIINARFSHYKQLLFLKFNDNISERRQIKG